MAPHYTAARKSTGAKVRRPVVAAHETWVCQVCTFHNSSPLATKCSVCSSDRNASKEKEEEKQPPPPAAAAANNDDDNDDDVKSKKRKKPDDEDEEDEDDDDDDDDDEVEEEEEEDSDEDYDEDNDNKKKKKKKGKKNQKKKKKKPEPHPIKIFIKPAEGEQLALEVMSNEPVSAVWEMIADAGLVTEEHELVYKGQPFAKTKVKLLDDYEVANEGVIMLRDRFRSFTFKIRINDTGGTEFEFTLRQKFKDITAPEVVARITKDWRNRCLIDTESSYKYVLCWTRDLGEEPLDTRIPLRECEVTDPKDPDKVISVGTDTVLVLNCIAPQQIVARCVPTDVYLPLGVTKTESFRHVRARIEALLNTNDVRLLVWGKQIDDAMTFGKLNSRTRFDILVLMPNK